MNVVHRVSSPPSRKGSDRPRPIRLQALAGSWSYGSPGPNAIQTGVAAGWPSRQRAEQAGFDAHMVKPLELDALLNALK